MIIAADSQALRDRLTELRVGGATVGFVPTMGNLHQGHLSLIEQAQNAADIVVASIFVNPMQFAANEDLDTYPRTLEADLSALRQIKADLVFTPSASDIYPQGSENETTIHVPVLGEALCGKERPGHFDGVCTVVTKLFNLIKPNYAVFGKKDYQQLSVIRQLVKDLNYDIKIVAVDTQREVNGLAISSRNQQLTTKEKEKSAVIYKALNAMAKSSRTVSSEIIDLGKSILEEESKCIHIDYIEIVDRTNLNKLEIIDRPALAAIAVKVGKTRLIDNIEIDFE